MTKWNNYNINSSVKRYGFQRIYEYLLIPDCFNSEVVVSSLFGTVSICKKLIVSHITVSATHGVGVSDINGNSIQIFLRYGASFQSYELAKIQ